MFNRIKSMFGSKPTEETILDREIAKQEAKEEIYRQLRFASKAKELLAAQLEDGDNPIALSVIIDHLERCDISEGVYEDILERILEREEELEAELKEFIC